MKFTNELIRIRKEKSLSQELLAKKLGCSRSYICKLETGERLPNYEFIIKVTDILSLSSYETNQLLLLSEMEPEILSDINSYRETIKLITSLKEKGLVEEALKLIEKSLNIFKGKVELLALQANLYLLQKDYEKAILTNQKAIESIDDKKKYGISKAELLNNKGYIYFEQGLLLKPSWEKLVIESWFEPKILNTDKYISLHKKIDNYFICALENIETAYKTDSSNTHIMEQLASLYMNVSTIDKNDQEKYLKKAIELYQQFVCSNNNIKSRQLDAGLFIALAYGRQEDLEKAIFIINLIISSGTEYYLAYYIRACIYSLNSTKSNLLNKCLIDLNRALNLNPSIKETILLEIDLKNLHLNEEYKHKLIKLLEKF